MQTITTEKSDNYLINLNLKTKCDHCGEKLHTVKDLREQVDIPHTDDDLICVSLQCFNCRTGYTLHLNLNGDENETN